MVADHKSKTFARRTPRVRCIILPLMTALFGQESHQDATHPQCGRTCQETVDGLWPMEGGTRRVRIMAHDWSLSLALHQLQACSAFHNLLLAISRIMAHVTLSARCSSNPIYPAQCAGVLWC